MKTFFYTLSLLLPAITLLAQPKQDVAALKKAVETNPRSVKAHDAYVRAAWKDSAGVVQQYQQWMKQFPTAAAVPFGLGTFYANQENPAAKPFLLKAVALDPKLAEAWSTLSVDAQRWGDFKAAQDYLSKAVAAEPENPDYIFYYNNTFESTDPEKYFRLNLDMVKRYPKSQRSAQALYWLAFRAQGLKSKTALYEQLRRDFPLAKFNWAVYGLSEYADLLLKDNPAKAVELTRELLQQPGLTPEIKKEMEKKQLLATQITQVNNLLAAGKATEALSVLAGIKVDRYGNGPGLLALLKARTVDQNGRTQQAYDSLLVFYTTSPAAEVKTALLAYSAKLGKTAAAMENELWQKLVAASQPASFRMKQYLSGDTVSIGDYKGKTLLLTFWFPGCGPCRGEFPHFERALKPFHDQPVAYAGINIAHDQDEYVPSFVKSSGYSFTALRDDEGSRKNLPVRGAPTNYLIDGQGRIIYKNFMIQNEAAEEMLQEMIRLILRHQ